MIKQFFFALFFASVYMLATNQSYNPHECVNYAEQILVQRTNQIATALFVPDDEVKKTLLGLIYNERSAIFIAQFRLTDKDVVTALAHAHKRGVIIKIIVDCTCLDDRFERISQLCAENIAVHKYKNQNSTMHNKFFIFTNNFARGAVLWTGSANATRSGITKNQENVVITNDESLVHQFTKKFESLWSQTIPVKMIPEA